MSETLKILNTLTQTISISGDEKNVASMADINIEEESFWQESLQSIADQIQDFLKELSA